MCPLYTDLSPIRREFPDQTLFWNAVDLEKKLGVLRKYYNHSRVHTSLKGNTPEQVSGEPETRQADLECYQWQAHCRGLVQLPLAA